MLTKLLFYSLFLMTYTLSAQDRDSTIKEEINTYMLEMQKRYNTSQQEKVENFSDYFKPELVDTFIEHMKNDDYDFLYENSDEILKMIQTKNDLKLYFTELKHIYGNLKTYVHETYEVKNNLNDNGKKAYATYKVAYDSVNGIMSFAFNIVSPNTLQLNTFRLLIDDYTDLDTFDRLTQKTFEYLVSRDYPKLYNTTSKRFQEYTSIANFDEFSKMLNTINFNNHKMYRNNISVLEGYLIYNLTYDINDGDGFLTLTYVNPEGKFKLEGIDYKPKE